MQTMKKELRSVEDFLEKLTEFRVETVSETVINSVKTYTQNQKLFNESTAEEPIRLVWIRQILM